jgi:tRNA pseudouridine55 synthase
MNAVLIIDKPAGLTSHDVVNRARRILRERSIGHLGTLDPLATGVLPLVTGNLTRLAQFYTSSEKTYEGTIRFGFATDTYDAEGEPTTAPQTVSLSREVIEALAGRFRGVIQQTPPPFSAKKIKGVPAYKLARQQREVVLQPVQVEIKELEILTVELDRVRFRARVASGTYMRSVAHEMGRALACGAHLESLRRTSVAEFTLEDAHTLEQLAEAARSISPTKGRIKNGASSKDQASLGGTPENSPPVLLAGQTESTTEQRLVDPAQSLSDNSDEERRQSPSAAPSIQCPITGIMLTNKERPGGACTDSSSFTLSKEETPEPLEALFVHPRKLLPNFPSVTADEPTAARIRSGRTINLPDFSRARQVKVFAGQRDLIAIATRVAGTLFHPKIVLCDTSPGGADAPVRRP